MDKRDASKTYEEENILLINTLNQLTLEYTEEQKKHLEDIFISCSRYELAFWEMAWKN